MNAEKLQSLILYRYRYAVAYVALVVAALGALLYRLEELLPGLSPSETEQGAALGQQSVTILEQGVNLPYNLLQTLTVGVLGESTLALRIPSVIVGIAMLIMMFTLIHLWHKEKIAIIAVLFLATSSWFLTFARVGAPFIYSAFAVVALFLCGTLLRHSEHPRHSLVFAGILLPLALYAPGVVYLFILFGLLYRNEITDLLSSMKRSNIVVLSITSLMLLAPLIYGFVEDVDNLKLWLGVSDGFPGVSGFFENILQSVEHILWSSEPNPELHLGTLAMLDIFTATMAALGLYHYEQHFNWLRTRFIIYGLGILLIVFGLSANEGTYFMAAPIIYLLAATGIITLLNQWNRIFPVNPFARTLALVPIALALLITGQYHLDRYFSAWALSPNTRKVFAVEPVLLEHAIQQDSRQAILVITRESEHSALAFLLNDEVTGRQIDVITPDEASQLTNIATKYEVAYMDGAVQGIIKAQLDTYISETITNDRQSRPIAYRVYDLSAQVSRSD